MLDRASNAQNNLRLLRSRAMMTQAELAAKAGLGVRTIRDIESGRARPQTQTRRLLIEALELGEQGRALLSDTADLGMPVPRELPRDLAEFTGRQRHLDGLFTAVDEGTSVVTVHGMAGVGKTSLAIRAAHVLAPRYPDGQVFVDLHGFTSVEVDRPGPGSVLVRVLRACNMEAWDVPVEVGELAALYRSTLAERRALLLFDNVADAEELEQLLPGTSECLVIATSRRDLSDLPAAHSVRLEPPPPTEAVAMIGAAAAGRTTADEAAAIAERCGRLPLAMAMAAARLRSRPLWSAADMVRRLDDEDRLLDELDMGRRGVAAAIGASYRELDTAQQRLLRRLSLVPGDDVDAYAAAALCGVDWAQVSATLESLVDVNLAESRSPGRYRLHDLVRLFAARLARSAEADADLDAAFGRLLGVYLHFAHQAASRLASRSLLSVDKNVAAFDLGLPGFTDQDGAVAWFQTERVNLAAAVAVAAGRVGHLEPAWHLASAFNQFRTHDRDVEQHFTTNRIALDVARRLGDDEKEADSVSDLGRHFILAGKPSEAIDCIRQAVAIRRRLGYLGAVAMNLRILGLVHRQAGQFTKALDVYREGLELAEAAADHTAIAHLGANMFVPLLLLGRLEDAEGCLADIERRLDTEASDYEIARLENFRGTLAREQGDPAAALSRHTACLDFCRQRGLLTGFAPVLIEIGEDLLRLGRADEAVTHLGRAVEYTEDQANALYERSARNTMGRALTVTGAVAAAIEQHERVRRLAESQGDAYELARAHHGLADAHRGKGDIPAARCHLRSAAKGYEQCGVPEAWAVDLELPAP